MTKETEKRIATGLFVRTSRNGKKTIRVSFSYRRKHCRESLNFEPTRNNVRCAINFRKKILREISLNTFNYAKTFPFSKRAIEFGHCSDRVLVRDLLDRFLARSKKQTKATTHNRYVRVCKKHLYATFGHVAISDLSPGLIWLWLEKQNWQRKTVVNNLTPLRAVIDDALIFGYIDKNPFDLINISRLSNLKSNYRVNPLNKNEIRQLLSVAEGQVRNVFQFAIYSGLRTSELIGLKWEDVDWDKGVVQVKRAVVDGIEQGTKTPSSVRKVTLLPSAREALDNQRKHTEYFRGRVFYNPFDKNPWQSSDQLRKRAWLPLFEKLDIPYRNLYHTRHTYASMLVSGGESSQWVSQQMGHTNGVTTYRYYIRWVPDSDVPGGYQPIHHW